MINSFDKPLQADFDFVLLKKKRKREETSGQPSTYRRTPFSVLER